MFHTHFFSSQKIAYTFDTKKNKKESVDKKGVCLSISFNICSRKNIVAALQQLNVVVKTETKVVKKSE